MRLAVFTLASLAAVVAVSFPALGDDAPPTEAATADALAPVTERFAGEDVQEVPSFQRHVSPLFGRLGCNGRSCHGSFQGRGDFRLSLFGYDFKADHDELLKGDPKRANADQPLESLILVKPTDADLHEGGQRYKKGGWEYHVFRRWLEGGAKFSDDEVQKLVTLDVQPAEILFAAPGETVQLKATAVWPDGTREDVTPLCRFGSNSDQVATITTDGLVTATDPGDTHVVISYDNAVIAVPVIRPVSSNFGDKYPEVPTPTKIDELVVQKLRKLGVVQSDLASDAEFLRRVSLDLAGTLPTAAEVEQFLADQSSTKRADKINQLLETPAYAAWWTTRLCDWTGNNDTKLNQTGALRGSASQQWYDWIYERVERNEPYDKLVEGLVMAVSRAPGEDYEKYCESMSKLYQKDSEVKYADRPSMPYYWARQNFRTSEERAIGFAYTFLGIRIQCAQCHKHPFDQWAKKDFDAFEPFFGRVQIAANGARDKETQEQYQAIMAQLDVDKNLRGNQLTQALSRILGEGKTIPFPEIVSIKAQPQPARRGGGGNPNRNNADANAVTARVLGGEAVDLTKFEDTRQPLMDWLRSKDNPYFAKAFVNRVWANYFNVGIVNPPDDLSLANPPSNRPLLDYLAQGFIENNFDMKWLHREIVSSRTYQLSWQPNETNAKDERNFARSVPRRLAAEVAVDAITAAVSSDDKAATLLGTVKGRAIGLPGSSARANQGGNNTMSGFALQVFGRSIRESNCDCDRSMDASLLQTVYLQNDQAVLSALSGGRETWIGQIAKQAPEADRNGNRIRNANRELAQLRVLDKAKKDGGEDQVKRIEERIAEIEKLAADTKDAAENPGSLTVDNATLIRNAYLRTLSRNPTGDEINRCEEFLASASTPAEGARGLLWTLINTKEFIVNH
jgi:hypothetical protein